MPSKFKLSSTFNSNLQLLADGMLEASHEAMRAAMKQAEDDARAIYRWRQPGEYMQTDQKGVPWVWEVTGLSAASITGYVVSARGDEKAPKNLSPRRALRYHGNSDLSKTNALDPSLMGNHSAPPGRVVGVVTMYTAYAPYLQKKEINGAKWGQPSAGEPVTIEVLRVNWGRFYVPQIIRPRIEKAMQRIAARLR